MRLFASLVLVAAIAPAPPAAAAAAAPTEPLVACRVLEAHTDATLGVTVVVFHQRDDADQARVGAILRAHDGAPVEFRTTDGAPHPATLARLKSCFGRGLLLFRAGSAQLAEKDEFLLREPPPSAHPEVP